MTLHPDQCITCGDVAVTATVVEVDGATATVASEDGRRERIGIELVDQVSVGDLLLCHAGIALANVTDAQ